MQKMKMSPIKIIITFVYETPQYYMHHALRLPITGKSLLCAAAASLGRSYPARRDWMRGAIALEIHKSIDLPRELGESMGS